jgi:hypothetical protein
MIVAGCFKPSPFPPNRIACRPSRRSEAANRPRKITPSGGNIPLFCADPYQRPSHRALTRELETDRPFEGRRHPGAKRTTSLRATRSDLAISPLLAAAGRRAIAMTGPARVILAGAAVTDILIRLLATSRAAANGRGNRTSDIQERLREFEHAYEEATGERLSTAAFYDRFCSGEFDTRFGARWATYYEATLSRPASQDGLSHLGLHRLTPG